MSEEHVLRAETTPERGGGGVKTYTVTTWVGGLSIWGVDRAPWLDTPPKRASIDGTHKILWCLWRRASRLGGRRFTATDPPPPYGDV